MLGERGNGFVKNTCRCQSHSCPHCAYGFSVRNAIALNASLKNLHTKRIRKARGLKGCAYHLLLTLQHFKSDSLKSLNKAIKKAWQKFNRQWNLLKPFKLKKIAHVLTYETTWGENSGWHPHYHVLIIFNRRLKQGECELLNDVLFNKWSKCVKKVYPHRTLSREAFGLSAVRTDKQIAEYLVKVCFEMGGGPNKEARRGRLSPFDLLDKAILEGDLESLQLFREWECALFNNQILTGVKHLKEVAKVTDKDLLKSRVQLFGEIKEPIYICSFLGSTWELIARINLDIQLFIMIRDGYSLAIQSAVSAQQHYEELGMKMDDRLRVGIILEEIDNQHLGFNLRQKYIHLL